MIRELGDHEYELWDNLVANSLQGTLFHKSYWLKESGAQFKIYGYFRGNELFAGLPITYTITKLGIKKLYHPFLTPYLGIAFKNTDSKYVTRMSQEKGISREFAQKIKSEFDCIAISFSPYFLDLQPFIWEGFFTDIRYTYLLELDDLNNVWTNMDNKRRNDITKAEKDGIRIEKCNDFYQTFRLIEKTFMRQGKRADFKEQAFKFNEVLEGKEQCKSFFAIDKSGQRTACAYIAWDEKRSYYLFGGYDPERSHSGASALAIWNAIKFVKNELNLNYFDFEGSSIEPVELFFRKFGGILTPYYSVYWMKPYIKAFSYAKKLLKLD